MSQHERAQLGLSCSAAPCREGISPGLLEGGVFPGSPSSAQDSSPPSPWAWIVKARASVAM